MAPSAHSAFSASASARLLACPGSYELSRQIAAENPGVRGASIYSAEGTLAHSMSEACLHTGVSPDAFVGSKRTADGFEFTVTEDMAEGVGRYVDYVMGLKTMGYDVLLEVVVSPTYLFETLGLGPFPIPLFGTSDVVAYHPGTRHLVVVDLKFGAGVPVEAPWNSQFLYYAAGALGQVFPNAAKVTTVVVQPRAHHSQGPIRWHDYTAKEVEDWAKDKLHPGITTALADGGKTLSAGKHCRFCPVLPHCAQAKQTAMDVATAAFLAAPAQNLPAAAPAAAIMPQLTLSNEALGDILDKLTIIKPWLDAVQKLAEERLAAGTPVPGWKLVAKASRRAWVDDDDPAALIENMIAAGIDVDDVTELVLLSPAQAEKKVGKARYQADFAPYIASNSSGQKLAPEMDARSIAARQTASEAFGFLPPASTTP